MLRIKKALHVWWRGEMVDIEPIGDFYFIPPFYYRRHWTAKWARFAIFSFAAYWREILSSAATIAGIYLAWRAI